MENTRKQTILIVVLSGVVLIMAVAAALIFTPEDGEAIAEPTPSATATAAPSPTAAATVAPSPTSFLLPLVPRFDTPRPTVEPTGAAE